MILVLLFFIMLFDQFVDIPVREVRKFLVMSLQHWIEKKVLMLVMNVGSCKTLTLPNSLFLFLCLQPCSPLKEKTIDILDVSGNSFVILMTA